MNDRDPLLSSHVASPTSDADAHCPDPERLAELADDFARRLRAGERPSIDEYAKLHPQLASSIRDVFPAMLALEDPGVHAALMPAAERPGATIGRYKLLERIGEGGFGVVFLAEQRHPVRRHVALKVIKPGFDTKHVIARFEAERQALALMDHENIARVLDGGATDSGRPFFVMELVHGVPITQYCDEHKLAARLELFVGVCRAVQHAHTKGIIHRDIKPTNVLVTVHEGVPVPKVIDFGIAKATGQPLTDKTLFTNFAQMVGTPLYMSPEQAEMSALDVDARSDVYSLGVLLYELLTGRTPVDGERMKDAAFDEVRRIIREEEPPRPSTRISRLRSDDLTTISARRGTDGRRLGQLVRGELDWIIMRALEKDRTRRYETASAFGRDVERHLRDEAVEAGPPSTTYKLRKTAWRHRRALAVAASFVVVLLGATVVSGLLAVRARRAEQLVARQRDEVIAEKQLKDQALVEREAALARATRDERTAQERLVSSLIATGDSLLQSDRPSDARDVYWRADRLASSLGRADLRATTGILESYGLGPPPLMGSDGVRGGIGGFEEDAAPVPPSGTASDVGDNIPVRALTISPDGRHAVGESGRGGLRLWDVATGRPVWAAGGNGARVRSACLSPDGRAMLVGRDDGVVELYESAAGTRTRTFTTASTRPVRAVTFAPDGMTALSGSGKEMVLWDVATGRPLRRYASDVVVWAAVRSPDGRHAFSSGEPGGAITMWDLQSGARVRTFNENVERPTQAVFRLAISPDGRYLAAGGGANDLASLWDVGSGRFIRNFGSRRQSWIVEDIAFTPDGRSLVLGCSDGTARLFNVDDALQTRSFSGHRSRVNAVSLSADGRLLMTGDSKGVRKVWDLRQDRELLPFVGHQDRVMAISVSGDGRLALSGAFDHKLTLWDVATGQTLWTVDAGRRVWSVALSADGRLAACGGDDGTINVHRAPFAASPTRTLHGHDRAVTSLALASDGHRLLSGSSDGTMKLWDLSDAGTGGRLVRTFAAHALQVRTVAFSPDGRRALSGSFDSTLKLWDVESGQLLRTLVGHHNWVQCATFSPDGHRIASGGWDYGLSLWDADSGRRLVSIETNSVVTGVVFTPDGQRLVVGNLDRTVSVRQLPDIGPARNVGDASDRVTCVALCPDGITGISGSSGGAMRRFQLDRAERYRSFESSLPKAREALDRTADEPAALATFGRWHAFRGLNEWAVDFLAKARDGGAAVSALELARSHWQLGRRDDAAREFRVAIQRGEAPAEYLQMCLDAVTVGNHPTTNP